MKKFVTVLLIAMVSMAPLCASAQDKMAVVTDMKALRAAIKSDKKSFVAATLQLTPAEAKKFWPIYDAYQRSIDASNRKRGLAVEAVVAKDEDVSNAYARNLAIDAIANDEAEIKA